MLPKVSPNSSLKNGPCTPCGNVPLMSPTFLRIWYHSPGRSFDTSESLAMNSTCDSPGREYARTNSY